MQSGETCIITRFPDLTYPRGSENKHARWGLKGTKKQRTGAPGRGRGGRSSKEQGQLKGGKGVKQALRTEDAAGTVCKVEIKWSHQSWMGHYMVKTLLKNTEVSEGLNQRGTQSHLFL